MEDFFKQVTTEEFKELFARDFPFLPLYQEGKAYFTDDIVYVEPNFYKSLIDNNTQPVTDTEAWEVTKGDIYNYVTDSDIQKAMSQAVINANYAFGSDDEERITIYLHLVAFYLVMDLRNASMGVNGSYTGYVSSKSVGDVSESYAFPTWLMNDPLYGLYSQNGYGLKYLSLILPYLSVTLVFSPGRSTYG